MLFLPTGGGLFVFGLLDDLRQFQKIAALLVRQHGGQAAWPGLSLLLPPPLESVRQGMNHRIKVHVCISKNPFHDCQQSLQLLCVVMHDLAVWAVCLPVKQVEPDFIVHGTQQALEA